MVDIVYKWLEFLKLLLKNVLLAKNNLFYAGGFFIVKIEQ